MIIDQLYRIRSVSNGFILEYEVSVPAEDPDDLPENTTVSKVFTDKKYLFSHLDELFKKEGKTDGD